MRGIRKVYEWILPRAVRNARVSSMHRRGISDRCAACSATRLGTEFLPKLEEGNMWIRAVMPPTITLEAGMDTVGAHPQGDRQLSAGAHRGVGAGPWR